MKHFINLIGKIIHIAKDFKSYDGINLNNRYMCILAIEDSNFLLIPMSTFHSKQEKQKKLAYPTNFEYSKIHGNTKDSYLKCDQIYVLSFDDFNKFREIQTKHKMDLNYFMKLRTHVENLHREKKTKIFQKQLIFEDQERIAENEFSSESER